MIRLNASMIAGLKGPSPALLAVQTALQSAIELEHSTIPPYLYALYSIVPGKNEEIASIIQSVVIEEMLHMGLACNVLNAVGGSPEINVSGFIPNYPGPLPGGVEAELTVHLAPFSMDQLQTFLQIEDPEHAIEFKALATAPPVITIGQFYTAISDAIAALGEGIFLNPPPNQTTSLGAFAVTDVATAQKAIQTIITQGEGTSVSPLEIVGNGYAHYYRFMQIQKGHALIATPGGGPSPADQYAYAGQAIPFDPTGVYPVPTDPGPYASGSPQAIANDGFNASYTSLLDALHNAFNQGAPVPVGAMFDLASKAQAMMADTATGPTFQYLS